MNLSVVLRFLALSCVGLGFILAFWFFVDGNFIHWSGNWDIAGISKIQPFMASFVVPLFSLAGIFFLFINLWQARITQFENNFFKLLDNHHKIIQGIEDKIPGLEKNCRPSLKTAFFDDLAFRIAVDYNGHPVETNEIIDEEADKDKLDKDKTTFTINPISTNKSHLAGKAKLLYIYGYYFHIYQSSLAHYFRNLYHTISYIDNSGMPDKKRYIGLLRAQLSNYELLLIAYNCMYHYGSEKFKPLIEKYAFLKNLNFEIGLNQDYFQRIIPDHDLLTSEYKHLQNTLAEQKANASKYISSEGINSSEMSEQEPSLN